MNRRKVSNDEYKARRLHGGVYTITNTVNVMEATLIGPYGKTTLEPTPYPYTIGRAPDNRIVVNDLKVSSHHAQIRPEGQGYEIIVLGSSNGTFVNKQQLMANLPRFLYAGDQIRIGDTSFTYESDTITQLPIERTVYGGFNEASKLSYAPQTSEPPFIDQGYGRSRVVRKLMSMMQPVLVLLHTSEAMAIL